MLIVVMAQSHPFGTCQACLKKFRLRTSQLHRGAWVVVAHGFDRPGTGHRTDGCYGSGMPPYEHDISFTKRWRDELVQTELPVLLGYHRQLQTADELHVRLGTGANNRPFVFRKGERVTDEAAATFAKNFVQARTYLVAYAKFQIRELKALIRDLSKQIKKWKPPE